MINLPAHPDTAAVSLSSLSDEARSRALAREKGIVLRTARRWVDRYRREGLTGLARKERDDKVKMERN